MCGIIGIISAKNQVSDLILDALQRLEYRGYDSAGIAVLQDNKIAKQRAEGKLNNLRKAIYQNPLVSNIGIGHTRWATHGVPSERNAHPHSTDAVAVVHNGIIENYQELKQELSQLGYVFHSDTDSEVIPVLLTHLLKENEPIKALHIALQRLHGAFALGIIFASDKEHIYAARRGSPLAIGHNAGEMSLGSDAFALAPLTNRITYLEEGDYAKISAHDAVIYNENGEFVQRECKLSALTGAAVGKGNYRHFMQKEIYEQPAVIGETISSFCSANGVNLPDINFDLGKISRINIVACGTSYYAGIVARYWLEKYANIGVDIDIASEFRYREPPLTDGGLSIFISQSGETADTLAALKYAKKKGQKILSIINMPESSMAHESDIVLKTLAGPEIGVAATKAFTTQLATLACLTLAIGAARGVIDAQQVMRMTHALAQVPSRIAEILNHDEAISELAAELMHVNDMLYIGRGTSYAIAMEGALKLKEISYIHAEAYAAGELKHGPIALIDENMPIVVIAPSDELFEKTASNLQESVARGAKVILISDDEGINRLEQYCYAVIRLPKVDNFITPILYAIPVQLLAYHIAVHKGTDVDQPRNLAKSVTVE